MKGNKFIINKLPARIPCERNVVVQSFRHIQLFATLWIATSQAFLSFTISQSLLELMSIESTMPFNHSLLITINDISYSKLHSNM